MFLRKKAGLYRKKFLCYHTTSFFENQNVSLAVFKMDIKVIGLVSPVHDARAIDESLSGFVSRVGSLAGGRIVCAAPGATDAGSPAIVFVRSGGVEAGFKKLCETVPGPCYLLASGTHNSLPAAMEMLAYVRSIGRAGEIIHGSEEYCASRLRSVALASRAAASVRGARLGVIGRPSDWLISCGVDYAAVRSALGVELVDIAMEEFLDAIKAASGAGHPMTDRFARMWPDGDALAGALKICSALSGLSEKFRLAGLTVRCFDLLGAVKNTGCLALAILNSPSPGVAGRQGEQFVAGCEGDIPAMISMLVLSRIGCRPAFMANPSSIAAESGRAVFAHCTVPLAMTESYAFDTHFESGLGVAVRGRIPEGDATIFRVGDFSPGAGYFVAPSKIVRNLSEPNLCRTQVELDIGAAAEYFLKRPLGNHHVICTGDYSDAVSDFMTIASGAREAVRSRGQ